MSEIGQGTPISPHSRRQQATLGWPYRLVGWAGVFERGPSMMNVDSYRQYAVDCVRQAQTEPTPEDRNMVLNIALAWLRLAQQTEALKEEMELGAEPEADESPVEEERQLAS